MWDLERENLVLLLVSTDIMISADSMLLFHRRLGVQLHFQYIVHLSLSLSVLSVKRIGRCSKSQP